MPITPCGPAEAPASHLRSAALVTALALIVAALPFLLAYPPQLHKMTIDLRDSPPHEAGGPYHRLVIGSDGRIHLDGARCADPIELRAGLDLISISDAVLEIRPHPELRYETFLEVLAVAKRANISNLRLGDGEGWFPGPPGPAEARTPPPGAGCGSGYRPLLL